MSRSTVEYLRHILDEANYLLSEAKVADKENFLHNETLKRAFVRSLEIMGEATKNVPDDFKEKYAHVEWRSIAAMRDRLIHHYFGIDYEIVGMPSPTKFLNCNRTFRRLSKEKPLNNLLPSVLYVAASVDSLANITTS